MSDQTKIEVKPTIAIDEETDLKCEDCSFDDEELINMAWMLSNEEE